MTIDYPKILGAVSGQLGYTNQAQKIAGEIYAELSGIKICPCCGLDKNIRLSVIDESIKIFTTAFHDGWTFEEIIKKLEALKKGAI